MKKCFFILFGLTLGFIISLGIAQAVHSTKGPFPCSMCHTMDPMIKSYNQSAHGGNNKFGVKVACVECHLPDTNVANYLYEKTKISLHDLYAQLFYDKDKIDWVKKLRNKKEFVFESSCKGCHSNLKNEVQANPAFLAHKEYFEGKTQKTCLSCHGEVGHKNLLLYLQGENK